MKIIVGLGNPGIEYQFTPHNMGFLVVDRIASRAGVKVANRQAKALTARVGFAGHEILLAKPETYMNLSGMSVGSLVREHEVDPQKDLLVIYDELDLPLGMLRIRERGSSAGHNGMQSILNVLGTQEVARVRMGIAPEHEVKDGARYVLHQFKKAQLAAVDDFLEHAADAVEAILQDGLARAMSQYNQRAQA